jgi:hypothetical protein
MQPIRVRLSDPLDCRGVTNGFYALFLRLTWTDHRSLTIVFPRFLFGSHKRPRPSLLFSRWSPSMGVFVQRTPPSGTSAQASPHQRTPSSSPRVLHHENASASICSGSRLVVCGRWIQGVRIAAPASDNPAVTWEGAKERRRGRRGKKGWSPGRARHSRRSRFRVFQRSLRVPHPRVAVTTRHPRFAYRRPQTRSLRMPATRSRATGLFQRVKMRAIGHRLA